MSTAAVDLALQKLRFRVYERLFAEEGVVINRRWLRKRVLSNAPHDAILKIVDYEAKRLRDTEKLSYWAYRGARVFRRESAVIAVLPEK